MANENFIRTAQALTSSGISSSLDPLYWSLFVLALALPLSVSSQAIVDFGASFPVSLTDIGNGDRLVVCRRPFGSPPIDSVYLETAIAGSDWTLTPVATTRLAAPGTWTFVSSTTTVDGLIMNGILYDAGFNRASLMRLTDEGEITWCNKYDGMGTGSFGVALPSEDSIVAFASAGPLLHRVVVGADGTAIGNIAISNTQNDLWSFVAVCATDAPSEHVVAGATSWEGVFHAVIARIGPTGALWMKKYYVPIPGGVGYSGVSSIVQAQDGGYTCIINAMDNQIPGIYYYAYMMHLDDEGNVLWCRGSSLQTTGMEMRHLIQLQTGDYSTIQTFDLFDEEINGFSSTGELIARSDCQAPCNMHLLSGLTGTAFPGRYVISGHKIAELGENGVPCGRSNILTSGGPAFVSVSTLPLTPVSVTPPTITVVPIPLADRTPELSATLSCGTTTVTSVAKPLAYLRAFPVPTDGRITLQLNGTQPAPVEILDHSGRVVLRAFAPGDLDISSLSPGPYECVVSGTNVHARIILQ
ncbi:MAG: hypothetical protein IPI81_11365 [Flavobacteriales bacterium]|nr:hypothetical protein [Flavobacteriales bacterium]